MSGGKSMRFNGEFIEAYFTIDEFGALHPRKDALRTKQVAAEIGELFRADENLERDLNRRVFNTDVEFATRPAGSTPVIAYGVPSFGPSPLRKMRFEGKFPIKGQKDERLHDAFLRKCAKRERKITAYVADAYTTAKELPAETEAEEMLRQIDVDQSLTGGGYDGTVTWGVSESLFHQLAGAVPDVSDGSSNMSKALMSQVLPFAEEFHQQLNIPKGSLRVTGFDLVRMMQDTDGMIGWPVFSKANATLSRQVAKRISIWSGVDVRFMVSDKPNTNGDGVEGSHPHYKVVDALCYAFDKLVVSPYDPRFASIIWTLARIQRHGYKVGEDGSLEFGKPKSRSVSPNSALAGGPEAMTFTSLLDVMKEKVIPWMPSLQDRETADRLIWDWYEKVLVPKNMRALALDWSKWDHHIYGWILATILYYVVRPLYHFDDQKWVDFAIVSLVFKYFFVSKAATIALPDEWQKVLSHPLTEVVDVPGSSFILVGAYDYLGSGAKLTHVGGSMYGEVLIHHCIPAMLGYEGVSGPQAGDDTAVAVPVSMIDLANKDATFDPIIQAAAAWGLEMNASKQIWAQANGEVANIFLQYTYNYNANVKGVGTATRYYVAAPFAEREKALSIAEQYMAVISKFSNGYNNPWIRVWIRKWFDRDKYACALFHYKGVQGFDILVDSLGESLEETAKRLELTYNWGLKQEQLVARQIPILPIMAEVASGMSPTVSLAEALKQLSLQGEYHNDTDIEDDSEGAIDSDQE